jgi:hypothetical protein
MVIKIAKNYNLDQMLYESDRKAYWDDDPLARTLKSDYSSKWEEEDVSLEELGIYIKQGYAIKINCK